MGFFGAPSGFPGLYGCTISVFYNSLVETRRRVGRTESRTRSDRPDGSSTVNSSTRFIWSTTSKTVPSGPGAGPGRSWIARIAYGPRGRRTPGTGRAPGRDVPARRTASLGSNRPSNRTSRTASTRRWTASAKRWPAVRTTARPRDARRTDAAGGPGSAKSWSTAVWPDRVPKTQRVRPRSSTDACLAKSTSGHDNDEAEATPCRGWTFASRPPSGPCFIEKILFAILASRVTSSSSRRCIFFFLFRPPTSDWFRRRSTRPRNLESALGRT